MTYTLDDLKTAAHNFTPESAMFGNMGALINKYPFYHEIYLDAFEYAYNNAGHKNTKLAVRNNYNDFIHRNFDANKHDSNITEQLMDSGFKCKNPSNLFNGDQLYHMAFDHIILAGAALKLITTGHTEIYRKRPDLVITLLTEKVFETERLLQDSNLSVADLKNNFMLECKKEHLFMPYKAWSLFLKPLDLKEYDLSEDEQIVLINNVFNGINTSDVLYESFEETVFMDMIKDEGLIFDCMSDVFKDNSIWKKIRTTVALMIDSGIADIHMLGSKNKITYLLTDKTKEHALPELDSNYSSR